MANKRMFSKEITNTDRFQSMKPSSQALYFHLGMNADDDGFIGNPMSITKCIGAVENDLKTLAESGYLIPFEGGVYLITDWLINNYIRSDRYKPTIYQEYLRQISFDDSRRYVICQPCGSHLVDTDKISIDKHSIGEISIEGRAPQTTKRFCPPSFSEVKEYCLENGYSIDPEKFITYYDANGWKIGRNPMKDWKAAVRLWSKNEKAILQKSAPDFSSWADEVSKGGAFS